MVQPPITQGRRQGQLWKVFINICLLLNKVRVLILSGTHRYYTQIISQIGVTGISSCYFIVWTVKVIFVQIVKFDKQLWSKVNTNLKLFYKSFVCPALLEFKPITYCRNCDTILLENSEMDMFINIRYNCAFQEN